MGESTLRTRLRRAFGRGQWLALRITHRWWCHGGEWLSDIDDQFCSECSIYRRYPW
jgi:hypothetical protein